MDLILTILCVLLMILLTITYQFNRVSRIDDLNVLFLEIAKLQPNLSSFTLRYDPVDKKYINVFVDGKNGKVVSKRETNPVGYDGNYIINKDHGTVKDLENGFTITGMDTIKFLCPNGYHRPTCNLKPLCEAGVDDNQVKRITYTQFNDLHLSYSDDIVSVPSRSRRSTEQTHPRIRIQCLTKGEYELQSCPENMLLSDDDKLECVPYDICTDRLSGYKHNYRITVNDQPLKETEYYICSDNRSVKTSCNEGTVFSKSNNGCITRSVCWGKGDSTLPRDNKSYILCSNDIGKIIYCDQRAIQINEQWQCFVSTCEEQKMVYSNPDISYTYGMIECVNDVARSIICDNTTQDKTYEFNWATSFAYTINGWPKEVLDETNKRCVSADDSTNAHIILNPVKLAWSQAMSDRYDFDLTKKQYVCDEKTTKYRWDYVNGTVVPNLPPNTDLFVDTGAPCQTKAYDWRELPWRNFPIIRFPVVDQTKPYTKPPVLIGTEVNLINTVPALWPYYDPNTKKYYNSTIKYDIENRNIVIDSYTNDVAPLGFAIDPNPIVKGGKQLLQLVGVGQYPLSNDNDTQYQWYTIATGKFDVPKNSGTSKVTTTIPCPSSISLENSGTISIVAYGILWDLISENDTSFSVGEQKLTINRLKGIRSSDDPSAQWQSPGFANVIIDFNDYKTPKFIYKKINVSINASRYSNVTIPYIK
jgi:hypothetical protein